MERCLGLPARLYLSLKLMCSTRLFFLLLCTSFATIYFWMQLQMSTPIQPSATEIHLEEALENSGKNVHSSVYQPTVTEMLLEQPLDNSRKNIRFSEVYRNESKLPKLKYILLWTQEKQAPFHYFKEGQQAFIKNKCPVKNCYVTSNRTFFNDDITKFSAIAFNGRSMAINDLPKRRSPHQKYIYVNMESAENIPVCDRNFDSFFNWTSTYRLDSDIPYPYILIRDSQGRVIGPKRDIQWSDHLPELNNSLAERLRNKTKAAAWFVSHCSSRNARETLGENLQQALNSHGLQIDVYGACGPLKCPRNKTQECRALLDKDYFFYLSFENSFSEDYVTEKLLAALQYNTLPIVYGGADYSRFLPPGSYLDASKFDVYELAAIMDRLISAPKIYSQYFKWQNEYTYSDPTTKENVCAVCAALNNKEMVEKVTVYEHFRQWWHPNYATRCEE